MIVELSLVVRGVFLVIVASGILVIMGLAIILCGISIDEDSGELADMMLRGEE